MCICCNISVGWCSWSVCVWESARLGSVISFMIRRLRSLACFGRLLACLCLSCLQTILFSSGLPGTLAFISILSVGYLFPQSICYKKGSWTNGLNLSHSEVLLPSFFSCSLRLLVDLFLFFTDLFCFLFTSIRRLKSLIGLIFSCSCYLLVFPALFERLKFASFLLLKHFP